MKEIRLAVAEGTYDNDDAYNNVIAYVLNKKKTGGSEQLGPLHVQPVVTQYWDACNNSNIDFPRYIWHFFITFSDNHTISELNRLGYELTAFVSDSYQIVYGVDTYPKNHLHFAINAFSYTNKDLFLNHSNMDSLMRDVLRILHRKYPLYKTTYNFK